MDTPLISVVLPTFNGQRYLATALDSVCRQGAGASIEVVAVDDGSTDSTVSILDSYSSGLAMNVIRLPHGGNWVANTNRGIEAARGAFVSILHQDDTWMPTRFEALRALIERWPEADVFFHATRFIDMHGRAVGVTRCPFPRGPLTLSPGAWFPRLLVQNFISLPSIVFRRESALRAGLMDPALTFTADWKLWLGLATTCTAVYTGTPLACYRVHGHSQTFSIAKNLQGYRWQLETTLEQFLPHLTMMRVPPAKWERPARFSVEVNTTLAALAQGLDPPLRPLLYQGLRLGFPSLIRYFKCSRIHERATARMRGRSPGSSNLQTR